MYHLKLGCSLTIQFCSDKSATLTITTAYSQHDLHQLEQWAARWQMRFAPTKCFVLSVTLHSNSSHFNYWLNDTYFKEVKYYKYLGIYITSSLSWSLQCEEVKTKGNKILCVLQQNLSSCDRSIKS